MTALAVFFLSSKMSNTNIKWFSFNNANAPALTNNWGSLIEVLDACLVTGFSLQTITKLDIENNIAIATFSSAHNYKQFQVVQIEGSEDVAINAEHKIIGITPNTIEFVINVDDKIITNPLSCRLAALGWSKPFSGTQKAVYLAKNSRANPYYLRVDNSKDPVYTDSYAKFAKVGVLESCEGIDDLTGVQAPYDQANTAKNWVGIGSGAAATVGWAKWFHATHENIAAAYDFNLTFAPSSGNREWFLFGNETTFYILPKVSVSSTSRDLPLYGFGVVDNLTETTNIPFLSATVQYATNQTTTQVGSGLGELFNLVLLKNNTGGYSNTMFGSVKLPFSIAFSGNSNYFSKTDQNPMMLGKFYMIDNLNNFVGEFPMVLSSLYGSAFMSELTPFNHNGRALIKVDFRPRKGVLGCLVFDLGEYH